jgi:hypothetical protein
MGNEIVELVLTRERLPTEPVELRQPFRTYRKHCSDEP